LEAEAVGLPVPDQSGLQSETLSRNKKTKTKQEQKNQSQGGGGVG
jgi:hypothetical protein